MTVRVCIVGAGPSGLSAAYALAQHGIKPTVFERTDKIGGLMASVKHSGMQVDLGRKELYSRIPEVTALWNSLLGDALVAYPHRVGSLYGGRVFELSGHFRGVLRGVPMPLLLIGGFSLLIGHIQGQFCRPKTFADYWKYRVGDVFSRVFARGYWEKFRGVPWASMPVPDPQNGKEAQSYSQKVIGRILRRNMSEQENWKHPVRGTGQIFECLFEACVSAGADFQFGAEVLSIKQSDKGASWCITVVDETGQRDVYADYVVSGLSLEAMTQAVSLPSGSRLANVSSVIERRHVVLVYLFSDQQPCFPHAWLEVNDPSLRAGRITNYSGFHGAMVPKGKTCLCVEFFCSEDDLLFEEGEAALVQRALSECASANLFDPASLKDSLVLRLERTNAAASWREQQIEARKQVYEELLKLDSFFHVNRPGSDWASYAGLLAGKAIATKNRSAFDARADPMRRLPERGI